ncbi:MAG: DUF4831 family protein [Bacteroidales bacterium]|nr:DUF4831 family protein [Bacteroidales bacterium]
MKKSIRNLLVLMLAVLPTASFARDGQDPEGYITYSLPMTAIVLDVEAQQEQFYAGPYAKYAEKYLGIRARQKDETVFRLSGISMTPLVEADQSRRYSIAVKKSAVDASFLKLTSQGLVSMSDGNFGNPVQWRFPQELKGDFSDKGVSSNLTSEATTLYRNEKKETAYSRVGVRQNMVVEKSLEQKAAEAAQMIVRLREQKLQIVTGDTDATYSGEAMGAAIEEMTRLEKEYMSLFIGYSVYQSQSMRFEVIPSADRESQMYVAFRISDSAGLVPADNLSGKPVIMEINPQEVAAPAVAGEGNLKTPLIHYMIPAICTVKVKDGSELLIQSRMPVYQLGREGTVPANATLK